MKGFTCRESGFFAGQNFCHSISLWLIPSSQTKRPGLLAKAGAVIFES